MPTVPVEQWPLVLAGPIVRRVEPGLASVWVALKEPRAVRLTVHLAPVDTGSGTGVFAGPAAVLSGDATTVRVGERLHVAVVTAEPPSGGGALTAGQTYAYNVAFGPPAAPSRPPPTSSRSACCATGPARRIRPTQPPAMSPSATSPGSCRRSSCRRPTWPVCASPTARAGGRTPTAPTCCRRSTA